MHQNELILASASLRRQQLLAQMGWSFRVVIPTVDEVHWDERPEATVTENATRKCAEVAVAHPTATIIAADTVVAFDGRTVGKPGNMSEAHSFLCRFSGGIQEVFTGLALQIPGCPMRCEAVRSTVWFRDLTDSQIDNYLSLVNPLDKAGGYNIDEHGELIIERYEGSHSNIMGLPTETLAEWLKEQA